MASRDVFTKVLPNVKLTTRLDAEGKEIQVERREDEEQTVKEQEIFDILVAAGYFRARIKGLSAFDKIVGGMTWCIVSCDYDVEVDLLFNESLSIGQKISLTEKIVSVLPKMKCPFAIEPHQIQGLDFLHIFPVIQWLVKKSVENREEKSEKLKVFALGQFHNHFTLKSDRDCRNKYSNSLNCIRDVQNIYSLRRKYKRNKYAGPDDEKIRVRITLLEYGDKGIANNNDKTSKIANDLNNTESDGEITLDAIVNDIDVDQLLKNLYVANEDDAALQLCDDDRKAISKHFTELKNEMSFDVKQLSDRSQINALLATEAILVKNLHKLQKDTHILQQSVDEAKQQLEKAYNESEEIKSDITRYDSREIKEEEKILYDKIHALVLQNEDLRQHETQFKIQCRNEMSELQEEIRQSELPTPEEEVREIEHRLEQEKERLLAIRMKIAKKNRSIVTIERQLDNIPDRTELSQYQRRFLELYNQVSAKHRETKQFYTLYNTLNDTKQYLTKELSLLNSIHENYADGILNSYAKEQFVLQFEDIVEGVRQTRTKVKNKCDEEKEKRDSLNEQLLLLIEQQRKYASALKQFTDKCSMNQQLMNELKTMIQ